MDNKQREMVREEIRRMLREEADPIIAEMKLVTEHLHEIHEEMIKRSREAGSGRPAGSPLRNRRGMIRG